MLLAAIIILAVIWLSQRANKITTSEEEEGAVTTNDSHPSPLPIQGEVGPAHAGTGEVKSLVSETFLVSRVIDGDTIALENGQIVRYIGMDAPEIHTSKKAKLIQCFGQQAAEINRELVEGKQVDLVKDISETDTYGRLLRYVYVDGVFVNDQLVRQGYAHAYPWPPDVAHRDELRQAQSAAKMGQKGLWAVCG